MESFLREINAIISNDFNHCFGNDILYCISDNKKYPWGDLACFADKIWLIGRSYAASPERRYIGKGLKGKELASLIQYRGDGTGDFFIELAKFIKDDLRYNQIVKGIIGLKNLKFDMSTTDLGILRKSIQLVLEFNELIRDSAIKFDEKLNPKLKDKVKHRQHISFCSKFLHFHMPYSIFIFDHFTEEGSKALINKKESGTWKLNKRLEIFDGIKNYFSNEYVNINKQIKIKNCSNDVNGYMKRYKAHCVREYLLCCYVKKERNNLLREPKYYTRMADSVCQRIQKEKTVD